MSERLLGEFALQVYGLRHVVLLVAAVGTTLAVAGAHALARHARLDSLLQGALAVFDLPVSRQVLLAYLVVRACVCLSVLWTHELHGAFLPLVLLAGSIASGVVARDMAGTARGVLVDAVDLCLLVAHAFVSGYLALVPFNLPLLLVAAALAIVAVLVTLVGLLGDAHRVLDADASTAV